jgi:MoaA/NifB/PqqE/SkfB family radical SAM enzyme
MPVSKVRCLIPFTTMIFLPKGFVLSCCPSWTKVGPIGNVFLDKDIIAIWNGKKIKKIREAVLSGSLETVCHADKCPFMAMNETIDLESYKTDDPRMAAIIDQMRKGKSHLDTLPLTVNMSNSGACNLRCKMCCSNSGFMPDEPKLSDLLFKEQLPKILGQVSGIILSGDGDPFFRKDSREFMMHKDNPVKYPDLKIDIITNGLLLSEAMWEKVSHNRFGWINVSVDAATKETYEKIRRNGRWEILQQNLALIGRLRREGRFRLFNMNCVTMKSNHRELAAVARMALDFGCDNINFQRITGGVNIPENINFTRNINVIAAIGKSLEQEPVFKDKRVLTFEIAGYRNPAGKKATRISSARTAAISMLFQYPLQLFYRVRYRLPIYNAVGLRLLRLLGRT